MNSDSENVFIQSSASSAAATVTKLPLLAAGVALIGLADSIYLTIKHYTGEQVPCSIVAGCEQVLTSSYAEIAGIPLAIFGAAAYFTAFSLAILAAFGNRPMWKLFGVQTILMAIFSVWLIYIQAFVIEAFCQFCLLSAATTFSLLIIYLCSKWMRLR
jgi:uncharacterized membrane protein